MKFCANLSMMFGEYPLDQRIGAARQAGFDGVEILFPYDANAADLGHALAQNGLPMVLINCPPPNYTGGDRGFAAVPGLEQRFERDLRRVLRYAGALQAQHIHIMAGNATGPEARATFIANLRHAVQAAPDQSFTIEPLNPGDMPGYFLNDFDQAVEIITEIDAPNLGLQFDIYHAQIITGDVVGTWDRVAPHVRHVQFADAPGRGEPGTGGTDIQAVFDALRRSKYTGWVSAEYTPSRETRETLGWMSL